MSASHLEVTSQLSLAWSRSRTSSECMEVINQAISPNVQALWGIKGRLGSCMHTTLRVDVSQHTLSNLANEVAGHVELAQGKLEVVLVVEDIQEVRIEGVDVIHLGKVIQDLRQLL